MAIKQWRTVGVDNALEGHSIVLWTMLCLLQTTVRYGWHWSFPEYHPRFNNFFFHVFPHNKKKNGWLIPWTHGCTNASLGIIPTSPILQTFFKKILHCQKFQIKYTTACLNKSPHMNISKHFHEISIHVGYSYNGSLLSNNTKNLIIHFDWVSRSDICKIDQNPGLTEIGICYWFTVSRNYPLQGK